MQQYSGHFLAFLRLLSLVSNNSSITLNKYSCITA